MAEPAKPNGDAHEAWTPRVLNNVCVLENAEQGLATGIDARLMTQVVNPTQSVRRYDVMPNQLQPKLEREKEFPTAQEAVPVVMLPHTA